MILPHIKAFLLSCAVLDYVVLIIWFGAFIFAHDWMYRFHGRFFKIPVETFDAIHYAGMAVFKIGALLFFLIPWIVLSLFF
jgi:hypothetical protein